MCDDIKRAEIEQIDRAYGVAVDNCLKDFFIKTGSGFGIGGAISLLFAKNKRWPLILGAGVGMGLSVSACQTAMRNASLSCGELPPVDGNCYEDCEPSPPADPCKDSPCSELSPCEPKNVNLLATEEVPTLIPQEAIQTFLEKADLPTTAEIVTEEPALSEIVEQFLPDVSVTENIESDIMEVVAEVHEEVKDSQQVADVDQEPSEVVSKPEEISNVDSESAEITVEDVVPAVEADQEPSEVLSKPDEVSNVDSESAEITLEDVVAAVEVVEESSPVLEEAVNAEEGSVVAEAAVFEESVDEQIADKLVEVVHEVNISDESENVDL